MVIWRLMAASMATGSAVAVAATGCVVADKA